MKTLSRKATNYLIAAGIVFSILVVDILVAKIQVVKGVIIPVHIGDTGQFLVLLAAIILFVIGAILREELDDGEEANNKDQTVKGPVNLATKGELDRGEVLNETRDPH